MWCKLCGTPPPGNAVSDRGDSAAEGRDALVLIGFMGAGKTSVGMAAAHRLRLPFVDTDMLIAEQMGPINEIFASHGEAGFRELERDVVVAVLDKLRRVPSVASLGGGAVLSPDVRAAARPLQHVVFLTAPVEVLYDRANDGSRPLATSPGAFAELLGSRLAIYSEIATATVVNDGRRPFDEVVDEVVGLVVASPAGPFSDPAGEGR
jgi:shikimate kinase